MSKVEFEVPPTKQALLGQNTFMSIAQILLYFKMFLS